LQKKIDGVGDRGAFHLFQDMMHSWVGYELVKVLLVFGLTPTIGQDLKEWSPDLFHVFTYMADKTRSAHKDEGEKILNILFSRTEHSSYFAKVSFGSKANFEKMSNTILPLVVLTWLRQLQENIYELSDNRESADWNKYGRYCSARKRRFRQFFH
jgi:hypothetical protein